MALIRRIARLFRADFHALLDRVEEPDILLRQSIREMEDELARDQHSCARQKSEREQLDHRISDCERLLASLADELDICLGADKKDLARALIRRRLETEHTLSALTRHQDTLDARIGALGKRLANNRTRYEQLRRKAELLDGRAGANTPLDTWPGPDRQVTDEDVEVALLKLLQRRTGQ